MGKTTAFGRAAADMRTLEQCAMEDSPIHRLHPRAKIAVTFVYLGLVVSFPNQSLSGLFSFAAYPVTLLALSGVKAGLLCRRLAAALPFAVMVGLGNLFVMHTPAFSLGTLVVTAGMMSLASILLKTALTVSAVLLLIATTPFAAVSGELARWGVPRIFCLQLALTYRYLSVLIGEARAMHTAYLLRTPHRRVRLEHMGTFLGQLILRSVDRAGRVYSAMKCRGFYGVFMIGNRRTFRYADGVFTVLVSLSLAGLRIFNLPLFLGRLAGGIIR